MATQKDKLIGDIFVVCLGLGTILALIIGILAKKVEVVPVEVRSPSPEVAQKPGPIDVPKEEHPQIAVFGKVENLRLAAIEKVPQNPGSKNVASCRGIASAHTSQAGGAAHDAGWNVVSDERYGSYQVVVVQSASSDCIAEGTSILVFAANALVAVAYDKRKLAVASSLARVERISDSLIRLNALDGPLAEIELDDAAVRLRYLPPFDPVCGGRSRLPRIERTAYLTVRKVLADDGWVPISWGGSSVVAGELVQVGGLYSWQSVYRSPTGDGIVVMTHSDVNDSNENGRIDSNEDPIVDSYKVVCASNS